MNNIIKEKKVAILATDGFEQTELTEPKKALENAGMTTHIISLESGQIKAWERGNRGDKFSVDIELRNAKAEDYDALVLPGGGYQSG